MDEWFEWRDFTGDAAEDSLPREEAVARLRHTRALLATLFAGLPVGLLALDNRTGKFLAVNAEFSRITGYSEQEARALSFTRVVAPEDVERVSDFRQRRLVGDPSLPRSYEILIRTAAGDRKVVLFHSVLIPFQDVIFASIQDITEEKLRLDPIIHAQKLDSLASLAGGLAGEFNNLLAAISGYAELGLTRCDQRPELRATFHKILDASGSALGHVKALLAFARSGTNALESVSLRGVLEGLAAVLPSASGRPLLIHLENLAGAGTVRGDATQLEQAFLNILLNAAEALPAGAGSIRITAASARVEPDTPEGIEELAPGAYTVITIQDNGIGIPAENRARVFQPFFTTRQTGTHPGLGLSTAYGIVRDHGGTVRLTSQPGKGTRVTVHLPREAEPSQLVPAPVTPSDPNDRPQQILVIDDQEIVGELMEDVLRDHGWDVLRETSARRALEDILGDRTQPHLVIVDLMMPDMDGRTFVRRLRGGNVTVPIVITSGYSTPADGDKDLSSMTQGFLRKPFQHEELIALVGHLLDSGP